MNLDHEQISELLGPYSRGELDAERNEAVRTHLDACDGCRSEAAALQALMALPEAQLDPSERVALRDAVREAVRPRSWAARFAPALGALGLVAIAVVGGATLLGDNDTFRGPAGVSAPLESAADDGTTAAQSAEGATGEGAGGSDTGGGTVADSFSKGRRGSANAVTGKTLEAEAESLDFAGPATFYNAAPLRPGLLLDRDAARLTAPSERGLEALYGAAPSDGWARQIQSCTDVVTDFLPADARPAYAAVFAADRILVMGFIWSQGDDRRYAFWGWPQDECSVVVPIYRSGTL